MRGSSQSASEHSLSLGKPPIVNKKILTTPKLGPKRTVSVTAFRIALTLDVKIVWFGCHFPKGTGCTPWFFRISADTKLSCAFRLNSAN